MIFTSRPRAVTIVGQFCIEAGHAKNLLEVFSAQSAWRHIRCSLAAVIKNPTAKKSLGPQVSSLLRIIGSACVWVAAYVFISTGNCATGSTSIGSPLTDANPLAMPAVGDYGLRVLSPTLLELTLINSKDEDPARVPNWDFVSDTFALSLPATSSFTVTANGQAVAISSTGFKRRPIYAPVKQRDLRIGNNIYLKLSSPIADGAVVEVTNPSGNLWSAPTQFKTTNDALRFNPAIHVNEVGYMPNTTKKAMVGYYLGSLGEMDIPSANGFKIINAANGAAVFTGTLRLRPDVGYSYSPLPYQKVYEADFTAFTTPGEYRLQVPGMGASFAFMINEGVAATFARTFALGLFHQRCGTDMDIPFTRHDHGFCHTNVAEVPTMAFTFTQDTIASKTYDYANSQKSAPRMVSTDTSLFPFVRQGTVDVAKGHHDAGDYSKYTINSAGLIHHLVFAADSFPGAGNLDNLGIPESGDGKSDLLQEAKWEADFLVKMQDKGALDKNGQPVLPGGFYSLVYPKGREYEHNVLPDQGDRQIVWPKTTVVSAAAVAALAEIGSSPRFISQYPTEAAAYRASAQMGWNFLINAILRYGKLNCYQTLYPYGDTFTHNDELVWAAAAMFAAGFSDNRPDYDPHTRLLAWYPDPTANGPIPFERCDTDAGAPQCGGQACDNAPCRAWKWSWWKMYEGYGCAMRDYAFAVRSNRRTNGLNAAYLSKCQTAITTWGDTVRLWSGYNAYRTTVITSGIAGFSWHPEFYFPGAWSFEIAVSDQLEGHTAANRAALIENLNYEAGRNPNNVSFVPGLGWKRQRAVVNQYAWNDDRISPPSGNPIGNVSFEFGPDINNYHLNSIYYPPNTDSPGSFALYDRWADAFNVKSEFVCPQTARSLAVTALLAAENPSLRQQPWCSPNASIVFQNQNGSPKVAVNSPARVQLNVAPSPCAQGSLDFSTATILWELQGHEPAFGTFTPSHVGNFRLEAEALFPDGRRLFAMEPGVLVYDPINGGV